MKVDVLVIGGGLNGLTAAACLARAGRKVCLCERRPVLGGLAASDQFHPNYQTTGLLHDTDQFDTSLVAALSLDNHDLQLQDPPPVFAPQLDGPGLLLHTDPDTAAAELDSLGPNSLAAYQAYRQTLARLEPITRHLLERCPPVLGTEMPLMPLLRTGLDIRHVGRDMLLELMRIAPTCVDDWLEEYFDSELLRALLMPPGLLGTFMGPRSPTTTTTHIVSELMRGQEVVGGPAALAAALTAACQVLGVEIKTDAQVAALRVEDGAIMGACLGDGTVIDSPLVISTISPRQTLLDLLPPLHLSLTVEQEVLNIRNRGSVAKVHLALRQPLRLACRPDEVFERIRIGEHPLDLERSFDAAKHGELPPHPSLDIRQVSVSSPDLAPEDHSVVSILVPAAPRTESGWHDRDRSELGQRVVANLARYAPSVQDDLVALAVLTPLDIERRYGSAHIFHGELALDQLWALRPSRHLARYRTPIQGLYLGSSGSHPGGTSCRPGRLSAEALLEDH